MFLYKKLNKLIEDLENKVRNRESQISKYENSKFFDNITHVGHLWGSDAFFYMEQKCDRFRDDTAKLEADLEILSATVARLKAEKTLLKYQLRKAERLNEKNS